jgi:hypothetical protein
MNDERLVRDVICYIAREATDALVEAHCLAGGNDMLGWVRHAVTLRTRVCKWLRPAAAAHAWRAALMRAMIRHAASVLLVAPPYGMTFAYLQRTFLEQFQRGDFCVRLHVARKAGWTTMLRQLQLVLRRTFPRLTMVVFAQAGRQAAVFKEYPYIHGRAVKLPEHLPAPVPVLCDCGPSERIMQLAADVRECFIIHYQVR